MASKLSVGAPVAGFLAVITLVCGTTTALGQDDLSTEVKESVELRAGEAAPAIEPLKLTSSTLFIVSAGEKEIVLRVTPDGFMQFVETGTRVAVTVRGARKNTVSFELQKGELASVWPVVVIRLSLSGADKVVLGAFSPDWAFVVRADEVRKGGLPAVADGAEVTLEKNQRLDATIDEETKQVVFLQTGQKWPGEVVTMPAVAEPGRVEPVPTVVVAAEPALPGVILDRERDFPWQTIPLPVIAWEVFRPPDVSP